MNSELQGTCGRGLGRLARLGRIYTLLGAVLMSSVAGQRVRADEAALEPERAAEYRTWIQQALDEFGRKNWQEARVLFRRAHELNPNARTLRGMGMVSYEMRDYVHAVVQLSAALEDPRQPLTDSMRQEVEGLLARSRTFVGAYALKVEPEHAEVRLDGSAPVRDTDERILVPFGEHTVRASAPGYNDYNSKLLVQGGEQGELRVTLYSVESPQPVQHVMEKTVVVPPPAPEPATRGFRGHGLRYSWVALGATAALGGAAIGTWFAGQGKLDELDEGCREAAAGGTPCTPGSVDLDSVHRMERATNALLGLAGAALVTTIVLASFEWPREQRALALDVGPNRLSLRGSF